MSLEEIDRGCGETYDKSLKVKHKKDDAWGSIMEVIEKMLQRAVRCEWKKTQTD